MPGLQEIVLTENRGFVLKEADVPVEIVGGHADLSRVMDRDADDERVVFEIKDAIFRVYKLPTSINGYIFHAKTPLNIRQNIVAFSAVEYRV